MFNSPRLTCRNSVNKSPFVFQLENVAAAINKSEQVKRLDQYGEPKVGRDGKPLSEVDGAAGAANKATEVANRDVQEGVSIIEKQNRESRTRAHAENLFQLGQALYRSELSSDKKSAIQNQLNAMLGTQVDFSDLSSAGYHEEILDKIVASDQGRELSRQTYYQVDTIVTVALATVDLTTEERAMLAGATNNPKLRNSILGINPGEPEKNKNEVAQK